MNQINPYKHPHRDDLLKIFNVSHEWAKIQKKRHITNKINEVSDELLYWQKTIQTTAKNNQWFIYDHIDELKKEMEKNERQLYFLSDKSQSKLQTFDIERIKEIPIGEIMPTNPVAQTPGREFYLSPFRNENTASFCWYKETNSWYDFGAGEGGDIIDLYMRINKCNFREACKALT